MVSSGDLDHLGFNKSGEIASILNGGNSLQNNFIEPCMLSAKVKKFNKYDWQ